MQVVNIVADRMPQILKMGVPVPDHIPFYMDKVIPEDHDRQTNNETQLSKHAAPLPPTHALMSLDFGRALHVQPCLHESVCSTSEVKPMLMTHTHTLSALHEVWWEVLHGI